MWRNTVHRSSLKSITPGVAKRCEFHHFDSPPYKNIINNTIKNLVSEPFCISIDFQLDVLYLATLYNISFIKYKKELVFGGLSKLFVSAVCIFSEPFCFLCGFFKALYSMYMYMTTWKTISCSGYGCNIEKRLQSLWWAVFEFAAMATSMAWSLCHHHDLLANTLCTSANWWIRCMLV